MNQVALRELCLRFPDATENVQWGDDLVFKVGGRIFAVTTLESADAKVSFKCTPEDFAQLVEQEGIKPADYVGRYGWVTLLAWDALPDREIRRLVGASYEMVRAKVPRRALKEASSTRPNTSRRATTSASRRKAQGAKRVRR